MENKKIAAYIRLSDEDGNVDGIVKAESNSVAAQRILIRDYIHRSSLPGKAEVAEYVDDGFSGTNFSRPAFRRMMEDAKKGVISCIIVKDFSRFGRDYLETGNYLERIFPLLGIRFISINDHFDSEDCQGMTGGMSVALRNIINSMYSRDLSKKVRSATATRAARGEYVGGLVPYGYLKNPEDVHQLVPDAEAAGIVWMIFTMAAEGKKKGEIARCLNEQGIPTCMEHFQKIGLKRTSSVKKEKKLWTITTIGDMLHNEVYLGRTIWNKSRNASVGSKRQIKNDRSEWIIVEGTHEPLVTPEIFSMANEKAFTHKKKPAAMGRKALPILFCPYCGRRLSLSSWGNGYRCAQASITGIAGCKTIHVDKEKLESSVLSCTRTMAEIVMKEAARKKQEWTETTETEIKIRGMEEEKKRLSGKKLRIYEDYRSDRITKEKYRREYESISSRIAEIDRTISELQGNREQIRENLNRMQEQETELKDLSALQTFDKEKLSTVIDSVQVYDKDRIEIVWRMNNGFFKEIAGEREVIAIE